MKLLITRPISDAYSLAKKLNELAVDTVVFPLIEIKPISFSLPDLSMYQALLVTSANSIACLRSDGIGEEITKIPLYAVGDASAKAAQKAGFQMVYSANGDLEDLVSLVLEKVDLKAGSLLYLSGEIISGDLKGRLTEQGYEVDRVALYEALRAENFSKPIIEGAQNGDITGAVLYSRRSARIFCDLMIKNDINIHEGFTAFCLSQAVAVMLKEYVDGEKSFGPPSIKICEMPTEENMIDLISRNID